jgi:hypothetical protein
MLQVTNGTVTLMVTKGAFKSFYEPNGFHAVDGEDGHEEAGVVTTHPTPETGHSGHSSQQELQQSVDDTEDEDEDEEDTEESVDLSEIPLGEMSFDQLEEYADQLELDHDGIRSKKELRALIREHLKK